jgi:hypothetical protein
MYLILLIVIVGVVALLSAHAAIRLQRLVPPTRRVAVSVAVIVGCVMLLFSVSSGRAETSFVWLPVIVAGCIGFVAGLNDHSRSTNG